MRSMNVWLHSEQMLCTLHVNGELSHSSTLAYIFGRCSPYDSLDITIHDLSSTHGALDMGGGRWISIINSNVHVKTALTGSPVVYRVWSFQCNPGFFKSSFVGEGNISVQLIDYKRPDKISLLLDRNEYTGYITFWMLPSLLINAWHINTSAILHTKYCTVQQDVLVIFIDANASNVVGFMVDNDSAERSTRISLQSQIES